MTDGVLEVTDRLPSETIELVVGELAPVRYLTAKTIGAVNANVDDPFCTFDEIPANDVPSISRILYISDSAINAISVL